MNRQAIFSFKELAPCFLAIFIDILGFSLVYPLMTALFTSHSSFTANLSVEDRYWFLGLSFVLYPLFMFFGSSFMGDLSDFLGRKKVLMLCMAGLTGGSLLMAIGIKWDSLPLLLTGRALSGLMAASMPTALAAIVDLSRPDNKVIHMSFVTFVQSIGFVIGPILGGVFSDPHVFTFFDFSLPFFLSSALSCIAFFWLKISFIEPDEKKKKFQFDPLRIFQVFIRAACHAKIRSLTISFFLMQAGIALYLQLILLFFKSKYHYPTSLMGMFNAFLGIWFGIGLLIILPYVSKRMRIERLATYCLLITATAQLFSSLAASQFLLWILGIFLATSIQIGFSAMLSSFSNAVDAKSQGWAMGITGSAIALSFTITGFSTNLVPYFGVKGIIFIGAILLFISALIMERYCRKLA